MDNIGSSRLRYGGSKRQERGEKEGAKGEV